MMHKNSALACALALLGFCGASTTGLAQQRQPMDDAALSEVGGRDGVNFAVDLNAHIGSVVVGTYDAAGNTAWLGRNNFSVTGTLLASLQVLHGAPGSPDLIDWSFPTITTTQPLQVAYDLAVSANGSTLGTSITLQNILLAGSSMQWSTAATGGIAFGMAINTSVDQLLMQPNGRSNSDGQMVLSGVKLGGSVAGQPWVLADVAAQPGALHVVADGSGGANLEWGIGWPSGLSEAPLGSLRVNNITFTTPTGPIDLGSSSMGSMQIQYLNVKFKS